MVQFSVSQRPELQGSWWHTTLNPKGQEPGALMSGCGQEGMDLSGERGQNLFHRLLFVLDWVMPTALERVDLLYSTN